MRAKEFIEEGKNKSNMRKSHKRAMPNLEVWPELDNNNHPYLAYRFGLAMASAPDGNMDRQGPIGSSFTTVGYSPAELEITKHAAKVMGVSSTNLTGKGSKEHDKVHNVSPVPDRKKLKK